ncbi:MAG: hypothetical protein KGL15_00535, partial [Acidobacteriota bacterium]|nr:hypothetical protein [Acidobacteriota bacterium]
VEVATALGQDPAAFAAGAGEDYELCFCASAAAAPGIERALAGLGACVTWIGEVAETGPVGARFRDRADAAELSGYEHSF